jgi:hypothetical protein
MNVDISYRYAFFYIVILIMLAIIFYFILILRLIIGDVTRFFTIYHFEYFNNSPSTLRFKKIIARFEILFSTLSYSCRRYLYSSRMFIALAITHYLLSFLAHSTFFKSTYLQIIIFLNPFITYFLSNT